MNFGYFFDEALQARRTAIAFIDLYGGRERQQTYGELDERATKVANALLRSRLPPGTRVLLALPGRVEFIEAWLGCMRGGFVPVPVNPRLSPTTFAHIARDCDAIAVIGQPDDVSFLAFDAIDHPFAKRIAVGAIHPGWLDYESLLAAQDGERPSVRIEDGAHCAIMYTSGSSGLPKGVPLTHDGQMWWLNRAHELYPGHSEQRSLVAVPLFHKNAMAAAIKPRLRSGGSVVLMPQFVPAQYLTVLSKYDCTHATGVPAMFAVLLQETALLRSLQFPRLESLSVGSAPVHEELLSRAQQAFGVPLVQGYGLTEGGPTFTGPPLDGRPVPPGSIGVPWPQTHMRLVAADGSDAESLGELWVRNPGVTPGYLNLAQVNAQRFVDGWLRTGDLFFRDADGFLFFRGRTDDMFICGGENIYPKEVENLLMQHAEVVQACVVPLEHETKGEAPVAMVVLKQGAHVTEAALKRFCLDRAPAVTHPRRIAIVEELPVHGPGKVDTRTVKGELSRRFGRLKSMPREQ